MAPTPRPTRRPVAAEPISKNTLRFFHTGSRVSFIIEGKALQRLRDEWEEHQATVLADWVREHPGTRPYAWWRWSAPTYRARSNGLHRFEDPARLAEAEANFQQYPGYRDRWFETHYGLPNMYSRPDDWDARYESEHEYLARLQLLLPAEIEALTKESAQ